MLMLGKVFLILLLLWIVYFSFRHFLQFLLGYTHKRARLTYLRPEKKTNPSPPIAFVYRNLAEMLESARWKMGVKIFVQLSIFLFLSGCLLGSIFFASFKGIVLLGLFFGLTPYLLLRMKLISVQMRTRIDFLPAVEVFYQYYVMSDHKNIRNILKTVLEENRILQPIRTTFEQLYHNLSTQRDLDYSLRIFSLSLGHTWAEYFVNILRMGLIEGVDISQSVKELITDMRKSQRADQVERNRLLEIRIANFTPMLFLALFLFINFRLNGQNAYQYYVVDVTGRNMLLDALLLIFASFVMGVYLSIKRM